MPPCVSNESSLFPTEQIALARCYRLRHQKHMRGHPEKGAVSGDARQLAVMRGGKGIFMGGAKRNHFKKEPYRKPTCEPKSALDVAALIRENLLEQHEADKTPLSMEELARPILLVKEYAGSILAIKEAIQDSGMQCHVGTVVDDSELPLICRTADAVQADVLLLDLRQFEDRGCNVLMEIGKEPHLRRIPLVILANSAADSQFSKDSDRHNLWRLNGPVDSEQCVTGLRSLLELQMAILKLPPKGKQKDSGADQRSSRPKVGNAAATEVGRNIDWEALCREIK